MGWCDPFFANLEERGYPMKSRVILCLMMVLTVSLATVAVGKTHIEWTIETDHYVAEVPRPLGTLISMGAFDLCRGKLERIFSAAAKAGYPLFERIRSEQDSTIFLMIRIPDPGQCPVYDGALNNLKAITAFGDTLSPRLMICSRINLEKDLPPPPVTKVTPGIAWSEMLCETRSNTRWVIFAGFPNTVHPDDIEELVLSGDTKVLPCGSTSQLH